VAGDAATAPTAVALRTLPESLAERGGAWRRGAVIELRRDPQVERGKDTLPKPPCVWRKRPEFASPSLYCVWEANTFVHQQPHLHTQTSWVPQATATNLVIPYTRNKASSDNGDISFFRAAFSLASWRRLNTSEALNMVQHTAVPRATVPLAAVTARFHGTTQHASLIDCFPFQTH